MTTEKATKSRNIKAPGAGNLLTRILRRNHYPKTAHEVKYAFTCGGIRYYQFVDFNNTPAMRGLKTMVFYEEFKMKCTVEYLRLHVEAVDNILTGQKKINIFEIKKLNDQLKQRLDIAVEMELLYKVASIVFFPNDENLEDYDFGFNARKVQHWKKHGGGEGFFLQQPLQELAPVLKDMSGNLKNYSNLVTQLNQAHLENLLLNLPAERITQLKNKSYFSAVVMSPK